MKVNEVIACQKCGTPIKGIKYDNNTNMLTRTCRCCGFVCKTPPLDAKPSQEEVAFGKEIEKAIEDDLNVVGGIEKALERDMKILSKAMSDPKFGKVLANTLLKFARL